MTDPARDANREYRHLAGMRSRLARRVVWIELAAALLLLSACTWESEQQDKGKSIPSSDVADYRLQETFNVGDNVYVRSLAIEPTAKALWVGTSVGVLEVDLESLNVRKTFTRDDGLANEYVFAIGIDPQGHKWFGTNAGGMSRYKDGAWKTYFPMHGLADFWVYSFANQGTDHLWIGTWAGANRLNLATGEFTTYVRELVNEWVYAIAVDRQQRVWFGTEGGVSMFDGARWRSWTHDDGIGAPNTQSLPPSKNTGLGTRSRHDLGVLRGGEATYNPGYVFCLAITPDGNVWAGTWGGGVSRFDGETWRNYTQADGLAGNIVYGVAQEPGGSLWFGTDRGVSRYDGETWTSFGHSEGLANEHVYAVAVDPARRNVWAGTLSGVTRIAQEPPRSTEQGVQ